MQKIQHPQNNINALFDEFDRLYQVTSVKMENATWLIKPVFSKCFSPILQIFEKQGYRYNVQTRNKPHIRLIQLLESKKCVIVCFSGGKDSTAAALRYREQGYEVVLYHLRGINLTYKDEYLNAVTVAEKLGMPLVLDTIKLTGTQEWVEHPMKNMIIANRALQYGVTSKLTTKIAFGNFSTSSLDNDVFEICGGDCVEMWRAYEKVIRTILPRFKIYTPLENMDDTITTLTQYPDIAVLPQSCIGAYRYREYLRKCNSKKYGIDIPAHRCGSCWKCCLEYCIYADNDIYEYNERYYRHCMQILQKTLKVETGIKPTMPQVWEHYFFYDNALSKFHIDESTSNVLQYV